MTSLVAHVLPAGQPLDDPFGGVKAAVSPWLLFF